MRQLYPRVFLLLLALGLVASPLDAWPAIDGTVSITTVGGQLTLDKLDTHVCYTFAYHVGGQITSFDFSSVPGSVKLWMSDRCAGTMWGFAQTSGGLVGPEYQFISLAIFSDADNAANKLNIDAYTSITKSTAIVVTPGGPVTIPNLRTRECQGIFSSYDNLFMDFSSRSQGVVRLYNLPHCTGWPSERHDYSFDGVTPALVARKFQSFVIFDDVEVASSDYRISDLARGWPAPPYTPTTLAPPPLPTPANRPPITSNPLTPAILGKTVTLVTGEGGAITIQSPSFNVCYEFGHLAAGQLVWYDFSQLAGIGSVGVWSNHYCAGLSFLGGRRWDNVKVGPVNRDYTFRSFAIFKNSTESTIYQSVTL